MFSTNMKGWSCIQDICPLFLAHNLRTGKNARTVPLCILQRLQCICRGIVYPLDIHCHQDPTVSSPPSPQHLIINTDKQTDLSYHKKSCQITANNKTRLYMVLCQVQNFIQNKVGYFAFGTAPHPVPLNPIELLEPCPQKPHTQRIILYTVIGRLLVSGVDLVVDHILN